jgi:hypothetical protein
MWQELVLVQEELVCRATQIMRGNSDICQADLRDGDWLAQRSAMHRGTIRLFYYAGGEFELATKITYYPKTDRYHVCYGVAGDVTAETALDLIISCTTKFMDDQKLTFVYGMRPKEARSALLNRIYDLAAVDSRIEEVLLKELPDMWIYRITYVSAGKGIEPSASVASV